jgi:low affinity Fe/Cu permease
MQILNDLHAGRRRIDPPCTALSSDHFERISILAVRATGGRWGFRLALFLILAWGMSGPYFRYHESWTTTFTVVTTSVTFLLVFLIQNAQNRESKAVHLKLDELIYAAKNARNELISIEHLTEEQLDRLGRRYSRLAEHYQRSLAAMAREEIPENGEAEQIPNRYDPTPDKHMEEPRRSPARGRRTDLGS